jgi:hypothetical protein
MIIQSATTQIDASLSDVRAFLSDPRNLIFLLPQEKVSNFSADEQQCSFKAQGGIVINLLFDQQDVQSVRYRSGEESPFPFTLSIELREERDQCQGHVLFDGEISGFMKMLVEKPLKSLFEQMSFQLKAHFDKN